MMNDTPPISASTKANYDECIKQMRLEAMEKRNPFGIEEGNEYEDKDLITDLVENWKGNKYSTLVRRRSALAYLFRTTPGLNDLLPEISTPEFSEKLKMAGGPGKAKSRPMARMMSREDYMLLNKELAFKRNDWKARTWLFISAGIQTGLRPIEWRDARWHNYGAGELYVETAKTKMSNALNRSALSKESPIKKFKESTPSHRIIQVESEYITLIHDHLCEVRSFISDHPAVKKLGMTMESREEAFTQYYSVCRKTLYRACQSIFKGEKNYSLSDTRSTFAAAKRLEVGNEAAAKILGHYSFEYRTARHYARKGLAWENGSNMERQSDNNRQIDSSQQAANIQNLQNSDSMTNEAGDE